MRAQDETPIRRLSPAQPRGSSSVVCGANASCGHVQTEPKAGITSHAMFTFHHKRNALKRMIETALVTVHHALSPAPPVSSSAATGRCSRQHRCSAEPRRRANGFATNTYQRHSETDQPKPINQWYRTHRSSGVLCAWRVCMLIKREWGRGVCMVRSRCVVVLVGMQVARRRRQSAKEAVVKYVYKRHIQTFEMAPARAALFAALTLRQRRFYREYATRR